MTTSDTPRTDALSKSTDVIVADMAVLSRQLERENNVLQSQLAEKDAVLAVFINAINVLKTKKITYSFDGRANATKIIDDAIATLPESAKQYAKVIEVAMEHYELEQEKGKKGHDGCDCGVCRAVWGMK